MTRIRLLRALPVVLFLLGGANASAADATRPGSSPNARPPGT